MMSHIMERYFTNTTGTGFVDSQAEAAMRTIMHYGRIVCAERQNYEAWSQVGLAGAFAHNGFYGMGHEEDWACHGIEHVLSARDASITHGAGLAVVIPGYLEFVGARNPSRVVQFAVNVMGVQPGGGDAAVVREAVARLRGFYRDIGMPVTLRELGAGDMPLESVALQAVPEGKRLGHYVPLATGDVLDILRSVR